MPRMRLIIVLTAVVGAFMALAPSANASLGRFINDGLGKNKQTATNRVQQLVEVNPKVATAIAADMGVSPSQVDWNSLKATSQGTCKGYNTGQGGGGSVHTTSYGTFACWKFSVKLTGSVTKRFNMKHDCSNPLFKHQFAPRPHSRVIAKMIKLTRTKTFKLKVQHVCPSGQVVNISVSGTVRIRVKARSWTRVWGAYSQKLQASVSASINGKIAVECGGGTPPPPPPPPPHDACVNIEGNQATVPGGMVINAIGNCVTQQITCGTGWYWSDVYVNCIQVVCGVVIVGDNNNVNIGDICSPNEEPPPTCPDNRPVPPSGDCDRPPQGDLLKPMHLSANGGNTYAYLKAYDPDGDPISAVIEASEGATTGPTVSWASYYDGITDTWAPCPSGWQCFRAKVTAGNYPTGTIANLTATITAGGKTVTLTNTTFPFLPDNGGFN